MSTVTLEFNSETRLSDRQFQQLCQLNRNLSFERNAQGDLIIMPPLAEIQETEMVALINSFLIGAIGMVLVLLSIHRRDLSCPMVQTDRRMRLGFGSIGGMG